MAVPTPVRLCTYVMYFGVLAMLLALAIATLAPFSTDSFHAAGMAVLLCGAGYALLVLFAVPAALYSFMATVGPRKIQDTGAAYVGRWLVLVTVLVPLIWWYTEALH